eukprot:CAMPEP_0197476346 /NCGR_PEP_ID=MMETSP1309-20131121/7646_1 /TAXON_ID=464262 /ORGANISM="Genus nov. species nov., Strain RCC998" /LENGTH=132 /DNA_ID=CAMNT_0043016571 /DNA_START=166 /DNA_END=565 /DNA_ORIENTATION=-
MRVIHWVHCNTSHHRPSSSPPVCPRLPKLPVMMVLVSNGTHGCHTLAPHISLLATWQLHNAVPVLSLPSHHRRERSRRPHELTSFPWSKLDIVDPTPTGMSRSLNALPGITAAPGLFDTTVSPGLSPSGAMI